MYRQAVTDIISSVTVLAKYIPHDGFTIGSNTQLLLPGTIGLSTTGLIIIMST